MEVEGHQQPEDRRKEHKELQEGRDDEESGEAAERKGGAEEVTSQANGTPSPLMEGGFDPQRHPPLEQNLSQNGYGPNYS